MQILAISGSLRVASSNTTLLRAARRLAPDGIEIALYAGLRDIPPFAPDSDIEGEDAPPPVADLRRRLRASDGVLISSPEYAHGVPGVLKNALDWIVSSGEFMAKPVALINASAHATYAQASLAETLRVMMADIVSEACVTVPVQGRGLDEAGVIADPEASGSLRSAVEALARVIGGDRR